MHMFAILRLLSCMILAISLGTYGNMARADVASGGWTMEMVICATDGPTTILVDSNGNPVAPAAQCCDCVACNAAANGLPSGLFHLHALPVSSTDLVIVVHTIALPPSHSAPPQARGPPPAQQIQGIVALAPCCGRIFKDIAA